MGFGRGWLPLALGGLMLTGACSDDGCGGAESPTPPPEGTTPEETLATATQPGEDTPTSPHGTPTATSPQGTPTATAEPPTPTATAPHETEPATPTAPPPTDSPATPTASDAPTVTPTSPVVIPTPTAPGHTEPPPTPTAIPATPTQGGGTATPDGGTDTPPTTPTPTAATPTGTPTQPLVTPTEPLNTPTATPTPLPRQVTVKVVDFYSGDPMVTAMIYDGDELAGFTDNFGLLTFGTDAEGPLTITATHNFYHAATVLGATGDDVRLPLRPIQETGSFAGDVDFSGMNTLLPGRLRLGLVTRSIIENPVALDFSTIVSGNRYVDLCTEDLTLELPANFVGAIKACDPITDYIVPGVTSTYSTFTFVGDLGFADAYPVIQDPNFYYNLGSVFESFQSDLDDFYFQVGSVSVVSGEDLTGVNPRPNAKTNAQTTVVQQPVPAGVAEDTPPLAFLMADMGATGYLPIGLAGGDGTLTVNRAPLTGTLAGKPLLAMSMAAEGGVGNPDAPYSAVMARQTGGGNIVLPAYLPILKTLDATKETRTFTFNAVTGAELYHTVITFRRPNPDTEWDIYQIYSADDLEGGTPSLPAGGDTVTTILPNVASLSDLRDINWQVSAYDPSTGSFDEFTSVEGLGLEDAQAQLVRMARHYQFYLFR